MSFRPVPVFSFFLILACLSVKAQDTLPKFSVTTRDGNKVIVSWTNPFPIVKQISIQRSFDSTRNFKTILTVPDPTVPQNGFVDTKAQTSHQFYRLFIVLDSGRYQFSKSSRPVRDTSTKTASKDKETTSINESKRVVASAEMSPTEVEELKEKIETKKAPEPEKIFVVIKRDTVTRMPEKQFLAFKDSLINRTKDTLVFRSVDTLAIKVFIPKEIYRPSRYVFTERNGNITIALPDAAKKHFSIKFFEEDNSPLFEIKQIRDPLLTLDKENFLHAGWFRFELYEEGKLKEKHKLFIPKDYNKP